MKVLTIVGTRPELIKLSQVIKKLDTYCEHVLAHTGQNFDYELNEVFFEDLEIRKPDYFLDCADVNFAYTIANVIKKTFDLVSEVKPDAILIYGDTNSCLSVIPAKRLKIPVFHMEAGNRCFDQNVPEELNRKIVDHLSDINMPISDHARDYLINEGIAPNTIIKVGSSMFEVLHCQLPKIKESTILGRLNLEVNKYFVVSLHREENVDSREKLIILIDSLNTVCEHFKMDMIFSIHPRTQKKLIEFNLDSTLHSRIHKSKPLGFNDYIRLQKESFCTISDSGTISEEASILNFPAITIRETHERPEAMDEGTIIMSGLNKEHVLNSIKVATGNKNFSKTMDYYTENLSSKVVKIIFSYTHYVNKYIWKK